MPLDFTHLLFICRRCDTEVKAKIGQVVKNCPVCSKYFDDNKSYNYQKEFAKTQKMPDRLKGVDISLIKE